MCSGPLTPLKPTSLSDVKSQMLMGKGMNMPSCNLQVHVQISLFWFLYFQAAIWHCLDHYDYFDAIFLAERLNAEGKCILYNRFIFFFLNRNLHCYQVKAYNFVEKFLICK